MDKGRQILLNDLIPHAAIDACPCHPWTFWALTWLENPCLARMVTGPKVVPPQAQTSPAPLTGSVRPGGPPSGPLCGAKRPRSPELQFHLPQTAAET